MVKKAFGGISLVILALTTASAETDPADHTTANEAIRDLDRGSSFFDAPDGHVVHKKSGMMCATKIGDSRPVELSVIDPRDGQDVRCDYVIPNRGKLTFAATRLPPGISTAQLLSVVMQSTADALVSPRRVAGPKPEIIGGTTSGNTYVPMTTTYVSQWNGEQYRTKVWLGDVNGWAVKAFASFADRPGSAVESWGRTLWTDAADSISLQNSDENVEDSKSQ